MTADRVLDAHKALIEAALAEALRQHWPVWDPSLSGYKGGVFEMSANELANALLATPDGSTLARWAAIGGQEERLAAVAVAEGCYLSIEYDGETWSIEARDVALDDLRRNGRARDLSAAISAALGEP